MKTTRPASLTTNYRISFSSWFISWFSLGKTEGARLRNFSLVLFFCGIFAACFADTHLYAAEPWQQLTQLLHGFITPSINNWSEWRGAMLATLNFALLGVSIGALAGFGLSLLFQFRLVRMLCAIFRAIHELFWALIFMQLFGLTPLTGVLAIAIPFACIFARVFNDIYQQAKIKTVLEVNGQPQQGFSHFIYLLMPQVWSQMKDYIGYRLECAIRTSTVLGFVGLPTLGFYLETAFKQGNYANSAALIFSLLALIGSIKYWFRVKFIPVYALIAWFLLPQTDISISFANISRFFTLDIWPILTLDSGGSSNVIDYFLAYVHWVNQEMLNQGWQGIVNTVLLTLMSVVLTWLLTVLLMPWLALWNHHNYFSRLNRLLLLLMRSIPEYILAFVLLLLLGPSMLPAVFALALHNSGLIGFLMQQRIGRFSKKNNSPPHHNSICVSRYFYQIQPLLYPGFLALLLYRAEIILRESAILGMLGITTLGFYIDSAFEDFRLDRAFLLLAVTALLNLLLDYFAQKVQRSLILMTPPNAPFSEN